MFVINPDPYSLPCYRIGPFTTRDLSVNNCIKDSSLIDRYFKKRFQGKEYIYTKNGREAINTALRYYNLRKENVVSILTTSGNFYVSGCVTKEIEKFCRWSRCIVPETKVIFVVHEFGYPFNGLCELKDYNIPIIEDCAGSFFSEDQNKEIGNVGDFVVYSFPKMFPVQIGGLLLSNLSRRLSINEHIDSVSLHYIKNVLSYYIKSKEKIIHKRLYNYSFLNELFTSIGLTERFSLDAGVVPGVFMFKTDVYQVDLQILKKYFWAHGIQSSVFYGEDAFFIPVHQALCEQDMLYFFEVMKSFINFQKYEVRKY